MVSSRLRPRLLLKGNREWDPLVARGKQAFAGGRLQAHVDMGQRFGARGAGGIGTARTGVEQDLDMLDQA